MSDRDFTHLVSLSIPYQGFLLMTAAITSTLGKMVQNPVPSLALISWLFSIAFASGTKDLGAVSSESRVCSEIGVELLKRGVSVSYMHDLEEVTDHVLGKCSGCDGGNDTLCRSYMYIEPFLHSGAHF